MSRLLKIAALVAGLLLVPALAQAQILLSSHDFSAAGWNPNGEICQPCHTPHNGATGLDAPLWNHTQTGIVFTVYSSTTLTGAITTPGSRSTLCFACHDGVVALDAFGGGLGTAGPMTGSAVIGGDLRNDHPVGVTYDVADTGLRATTAPFGAGTIASVLFGGVVECASCHDVHNGGTGANLLRISNANSGLCLACHNK